MNLKYFLARPIGLTAATMVTLAFLTLTACEEGPDSVDESPDEPVIEQVEAPQQPPPADQEVQDIEQAEQAAEEAGQRAGESLVENASPQESPNEADRELLENIGIEKIDIDELDHTGGAGMVGIGTSQGSGYGQHHGLGATETDDEQQDPATE